MFILFSHPDVDFLIYIDACIQNIAVIDTHEPKTR